MKIKKFLIIMISVFIIMPATVFATSNIISSVIIAPKDNENEIITDYSKIEYSEEEYLKNRQQKEAMQKEYIENKPEEEINKSRISQNQNTDTELENKIKENDKEIANNIQYIINIAKKYYPNKLNEILLEAETEENQMKNSGTYIAISKAECKLINLIIDIITQEDVTEDEINILKEYISNQDFKLKEVGETELLKKLQDTLNK